MNILRKSNFWLVVTTGLCILFLFSKCSQEQDLNQLTDRVPYLFLTSPRPLNNEHDLKTISEAFKRVTIVKSNGLLKMEQSCAEEINVSEELFALLVSSVNHTNELILSVQPKISFPRLKSGEEESPDDNGGGFSYSNVDCVAHAIAACSGIPFSEVDAWIRGNEDFYVDGVFQGVPGDQFESVCRHFMNGGLVEPHEVGSICQDAIIVFEFGDGYYHAVNSMFFDNVNGTFAYSDHQNLNQDGDPSSGVGDISSITHIFLKY